MKKSKLPIILFLIISLLHLTKNIYASEGRGFSAGFIIGEPTGLSFKYNNFPVIGAGWSIYNHFHLQCDYWVYIAQIMSKFYFFAGIGGKYLYYSDTWENNKNHEDEKHSLGSRLPFGLQYFPVQIIEIFFEAAPGILLIPATKFDFNAGIGARYYFP